jgi:hypothetical protein
LILIVGICRLFVATEFLLFLALAGSTGRSEGSS